MQASDGTLYGVTQYGGTNGDGTAFRLGTDGTLATLASFDLNVTGGNPFAPLAMGPDGRLYGTTYYGGANNVGTVYTLTTNGGLTAIVTFNTTNGAWPPYAGLMASADGNMIRRDGVWRFEFPRNRVQIDDERRFDNVVCV